jgi:glucose/arabinose dehydrogenase
MPVSCQRTPTRFLRKRGVRLRRALALQLSAVGLLIMFPLLAVAQEGGSQTVAPSAAVQPALGLQLPAGFSEELVVEGLVAPTAFAFLPDGRILFAEQAGMVRVWKDGVLLAEPVLDVSEHVNVLVESGLVGLAVDSDFANTGFIYVLYAYDYAPTDPEALPLSPVRPCHPQA